MDKRLYYQSSQVANAYDEVRFASRSGKFAHEIELSAVRQAFDGSEKILEIACGTGRLLKDLRREGRNVHGLEQSKAMLQAGGLANEPYVVEGDAFKAPVASQSFDGIYCFRFTNHYHDLRPLFNEIHRILKPGGHALFDMMHWSFLIFDSKRWGGKNFTSSRRTVESWVKQSGLRAESVHSLFPISPYLIAHLPRFLVKGIIATRPLLPTSLNAVHIWHVRKPK